MVSSAVYCATRSPLYAAVSFAGGVFIDADHFLDYFFNHGFERNLIKIYNRIAARDLSRIYVLLHSIELVAILWLLIWLLRPGGVYIAFMIGFTQHMILDLLFNPVFPRAYFLTYRLIHRFRKSSILTISTS